jgi:peptidoglycan/xylan/chitin deacetylase (PgdA/CDA1 family)
VAPAWADDDAYCTGTYGDKPAKAGAPLRFGVDPELAGSVGTGQSSAKPLDEAKDLAALAKLTPPGKAMVLRVNRLFWADGEAGIKRFEEIVARHDAAGFDSEIQVRYHPAESDVGDMKKWAAYVRHVVDVFGADRHVVAMTITNEVNLNISQNTSDGAYDGARQAVIDGIVAARDEADRIGRRDLRFGFTYAYRWQPGSDAAFWTALAAGGEKFRQALDFVGVDIYPGTFYPPAIAPTTTPGAEMVKGIATVRDCYMPKAKLGADVPIWVTENGFESGAEGDDDAQAVALRDMVDSTVKVAGTYGVTDYRWFNLRDNLSGSAGIFDTTGLLRDDYAAKPSFAAYRSLVADHGASARPPCVASVTLTLPRATRSYSARLDGHRVHGVRHGRRLTIRLRRAGTYHVVVVARTRSGRKVTLRATATGCAPAKARAASTPETTVTLEFDVATADQVEAIPLLTRYGFHATFFVNSGFVNQPGHLTWDQLRSLQASGHEIAGQTIHHARLTKLSHSAVRHEVCDDRGRLLAQGLAVDAFAYPFGAYNHHIRAVVKQCGYSSARLASGIAGAGKKCLRCPFAETLPPHNVFATRMPAGVQRTSTVARLERAILDAQRHGGGWVQILIHHVCHRCHRYAIDKPALARLLAWLHHHTFVRVRTVSQLLDSRGPSVRIPIVGGASRKVGDRVTFHVRYRAPAGVSRVRFFVDGRQVGVRHFAPWRLRYFSGHLKPGAHGVRALLEDERGNTAVSPEQTIVRSAPSPPANPSPTPAGQTGAL